MKDWFPLRRRVVCAASMLGTLLILLNRCAFAQLVIGNLGIGSNPPGGMQVGQFSQAVEFAMGSTDLTVGTVDLDLFDFDPKNFAVAIQSDNGGSPFGPVGSFAPPVTGGSGPAVFTFTAATPFLLKGNTWYWLVVSAALTNPTRWGTDNRATMIGSAQYLGAKFLDPVRGDWRMFDAPLFSLTSSVIGLGPGGGTDGGGDPLALPHFNSYKFNPDGSFHFTLTGSPNVKYTLLTSRNLTLGWTTLATLTSTNGVINYDDIQAIGGGQTFYEVRSVP